MATSNHEDSEPKNPGDVIEDLEPLGAAPIPPRIAPPKLGAPMANPIQSSLTEDDVEFISKVFAQVRHVDFKAAPPEGNPRLTGIDKKLFGLREQARKLERDLSRVAYIWGLKQQEIDSAAEWVGSKDELLMSARKHLEETGDKLSLVEEELVALRTKSLADAESLGGRLEEQTQESANLNLRLLSLQDELDQEREDWATTVEQVRDDAAKKSEQAAGENLRSQRAYDALKGLSQSEKESHKLQQQSLRLQISELMDKLTHAEIVEIELQRKIIAKTSAVTQGAAELEATQKSVSILRTQLDALNESTVKTAQSANDEHEAVMADLALYKQRADEQETSSKKIDDEIAQLSGSLAASEESLSALQSDLALSQQQKQEASGDYRDELARQRTAQDQTKAQHGRESQASENVRRELEAELLELRDTLSGKEESIATLEESFQEEQSRREGADSRVTEQEDLNRSNLQIIQQLQTRLREANQSLTESQSGFVEIKARLDSSESDKDALVQRLSDLEN